MSFLVYAQHDVVECARDIYLLDGKKSTLNPHRQLFNIVDEDTDVMFFLSFFRKTFSREEIWEGLRLASRVRYVRTYLLTYYETLRENGL